MRRRIGFSTGLGLSWLLLTLLDCLTEEKGQLGAASRAWKHTLELLLHELRLRKEEVEAGERISGDSIFDLVYRLCGRATSRCFYDPGVRLGLIYRNPVGFGMR